MSLPRRTPRSGASASPSLALPKGPTRADQRAARPTPPPAPQRRRASVERGITKLKKTEAKVRDCFRCLVPGCSVQGRQFVEAAHVEDSGMGGRFSVSSERKHFATACRDHHQGAKSLHTTHLMVKPLSAAGADGELAWYYRDRVGNVWGAYTLIGISRPALPSVRS